MGISVGTGIVSVGTAVGADVGAGVEVCTTVVAAVVITAVVSKGVVSAGVRFEHEDSISMKAIRIESTLVKRCVFIYLRPFRNVIDGIF